MKLSDIKEIRTFGATTKETDKDKNSGKDFIFRSKEWGDWTAKSEDIGRFFFVHQSPSLLKKSRALVDDNYLQASYDRISGAILPPVSPREMEMPGAINKTQA